MAFFKKTPFDAGALAGIRKYKEIMFAAALFVVFLGLCVAMGIRALGIPQYDWCTPSCAQQYAELTSGRKCVGPSYRHARAAERNVQWMGTYATREFKQCQNIPKNNICWWGSQKEWIQVKFDTLTVVKDLPYVNIRIFARVNKTDRTPLISLMSNNDVIVARNKSICETCIPRMAIFTYDGPLYQGYQYYFTFIGRPLKHAALMVEAFCCS